jgi:hypothetical protein
MGQIIIAHAYAKSVTAIGKDKIGACLHAGAAPWLLQQ